MQKRILTALVCLIIVLTLLPTSALATEYTSWDAAMHDSELGTGDIITIDGVKYTYGGDLEDGTDRIDLESVASNIVYKAGTGTVLWVNGEGEVPGKLTLDSAQISATGDTLFALYRYTTIELLGENSISKLHVDLPLTVFRGSVAGGTITMIGSGTIDTPDRCKLINAGTCAVKLTGGERWGNIENAEPTKIITLENVTIPNTKMLHLQNANPIITTNNVTVNGTLSIAQLAGANPAEKGKTILNDLRLLGSGFVRDGDSSEGYQEFYTLSGKPAYKLTNTLDFSLPAADSNPGDGKPKGNWKTTANLTDDGYHFSGNAASGYTLELGNLIIDNSSAVPCMKLPNNGDVTIILADGTTTRLITENNAALNAERESGQPFNHTIKGNGKLEIENSSVGTAALETSHNLTIAGGSIFITNKGGVEETQIPVGIKCSVADEQKTTLNIIGGKLSIETNGCAINASGGIMCGSGMQIKTPENADIGGFDDSGTYVDGVVNTKPIDYYTIMNEANKPAKTVVIESSNPAPADSGYNDSPSPVTVYNDPSVPNATVWLTGSGLDSGDMLVTERAPQGSAYDALLQLANSSDVFATYNIHLNSGKKSTGSAMDLSFDLNARYAGENFTLVHQKDDTTYEYFYDTADANGDLSFGPLYELSPFMLVKGTLAQMPVINLVGIPKTGDHAQPALWAGVVLLMTAALAGIMLRKRRRDS